MATRARRHVGLLALPDDLLAETLSYGDLRARFTCVAACSQLRDAQDRLSPAHEHRLLVREFPILKPLLDANKTLAPASVYRSQRKLFHSVFTPDEPITPMEDAYTFYAEVELLLNGDALETIYVGKGTLGTYFDTSLSAAVSFPIPADIWSRQNYRGDDIRITVMVSRARGGFVDCARLFRGDLEDSDGNSYYFGSHVVQYSPAAVCFKSTAWPMEELDTTCHVVWYGPDSPHTHKISVLLERNHESEMTVDQARHMLEFIDWTRM